MPQLDPFEAKQHDLNPERDADRERAMANVTSRLHDREIPLTGSESSEQLVDILTAVEEFEAAVSLQGGDNMNNAADSADPEDPRLVLPKRQASDSPAAYIARVREAASRLGSGVSRAD